MATSTAGLDPCAQHTSAARRASDDQLIGGGGGRASTCPKPASRGIIRDAAGASVRAAQPPLGKYANKSSLGGSTTVDLEERKQRAQARRAERATIRYKLREVSNLKRVRDCGHTPVGGDGSGPVLKIRADGVAYLSGLAHCGSVWACPVCAATIATRRAEELADVMRVALERGYCADMVTLTMRHHAGQTLSDCWNAASKAWAAVTSGKAWTEDQAMGGLVGWIKAVEVTQGANGWHVHLHVLAIWQGGTSRDMSDAIAGRMWARWARSLRRNGFDSVMESGGLDVRRASLKAGASGGLHDYFTKMAHEITGGQGKKGRFGGRAPFEVLTDALSTGLLDDIERWWEWEAASKGRRQMAWSDGAKELRRLAGLEAEQATDEELANQDAGGDELVGINGEDWRGLRHHPALVCGLLEAAESGGLAGALAWFDAHGVRWLFLMDDKWGSGAA